MDSMTHASENWLIFSVELQLLCTHLWKTRIHKYLHMHIRHQGITWHVIFSIYWVPLSHCNGNATLE